MTDYSIVADSSLHSLPYELSSLRDENGKLVLEIMGADGRMVCVVFDDYIFFSKQDEGDALRTLGGMREAGVLGRAVIIRAKKSSLLRWFIDEGCGVKIEEKISHYIIVLVDDVVNVICITPPLVIYNK
ncbi:hypothetical protein [Cupriavidus pampae]|uniref:hypothetical protein n=1 Tax=Cupriavidus pampae TaxID=659251 RepID=UPI001CC41816|nr:hypothetical protein [Cupriavidus pampae]